MKAAAILWRRVDHPGHDSCRIRARTTGYELVGTALFLADREACRFDYRVVADQEWRTTNVQICGWRGEDEIRLQFKVSPAQRWKCNGRSIDAVEGCVDIDLAFSPATNTLPINRLKLSDGECAKLSSAWLTFPEFDLTRLDQVYRRSGPGTYSYSAPSLGFTADLTVNEFGLVTDYPGLWTQEA
jgi:hypothetical protein